MKLLLRAVSDYICDLRLLAMIAELSLIDSRIVGNLVYLCHGYFFVFQD